MLLCLLHLSVQVGLQDKNAAHGQGNDHKSVSHHISSSSSYRGCKLEGTFLLSFGFLGSAVGENVPEPGTKGSSIDVAWDLEPGCCMYSTVGVYSVEELKAVCRFGLGVVK